MSDVVSTVVELGCKKVKKSFLEKSALAFVAGAMIAFAYMAYIVVRGSVGGGLGNLLGASIFPVALIVILLAGGELITGNMMVVGCSCLHHKVTVKDTVINWATITFFNVVGAIFATVLFGYYLETTLPYVDVVQTVAEHKVHATFMQMFISGIACNWFVGLGVWMSQSIKDGAGKILAIWFTITTFVVLGFQHSVANIFVLTLSHLYGGVSLMQIVTNFICTYSGNIVGGVIFVGAMYSFGKKH